MAEPGHQGRRGSEVLDAIWDQVEATPTAPTSGPAAFRAKALGQLDVATQVDNQLPLVPRRSWLLLVGVAVLVVAFLLWAALTPSIRSVTADARVVAPGGLTPVAVAAPGVVTEVAVTEGDRVGPGAEVAVVDTAAGSQVLRAAAPGTVWQVLRSPGAAVQPGDAVATLLPPGSDRAVLIAVPEDQAGPVAVGMKVTAGPVTGTVAAVRAPVPAPVAMADTGIVLPPDTTYLLVVAALDAPLPPGAGVTASVVLSETSVLQRLLGRS